MSNPLTRIILAGLNVFVAIIFLWLAALGQTKRAWAYNVYLYDVALQGLPVDENELDTNGNPLVDKLTDKTLAGVFDRGSPVRTQKEAVEAKYSEVRRQIDGLGEAEKRAELVRVLKALARGGPQRDAVADMTTEELQAALEKAFEPARTGKLDGKDLNLDQRRLAAAHILINLGTTQDDWDKAQRVVGLETFARELDKQAEALGDAAQWAQRNLDTDRTAFDVHHRRLLQQIIVQAERVSDLKTTLAQHKAMSEKHRVLVNARQGDVKKYETNLAAARQELDRALAEQTRLEQELFAAQQRVSRTTDANRQLELELKQQEPGR
jgi:hypothetical protein